MTWRQLLMQADGSLGSFPMEEELRGPGRHLTNWAKVQSHSSAKTRRRHHLLHTDLPSSEHTAMTVSKVLVEKSTLLSMYLRSGSWMRSVLCIGVKWMRASAVMLYRSNVQRVLSSQMFFSGHHMAWSDQSMAMSETTRKSKVKILRIWIKTQLALANQL